MVLDLVGGAATGRTATVIRDEHQDVVAFAVSRAHLARPAGPNPWPWQELLRHQT